MTALKILTRNSALFTCVAAFLVGSCGSKAADDAPGLQNLLRQMQDAADRQGSNLCSYSVVRKYTLENKHLRPSAEMRAKLTYKRDGGKHFQILSMRANGVVRRSLVNLLNEELKTNTSKENNNAVDPFNYRFAFLGDDSCERRHCYRLSITPKRKSQYLIQGSAWVGAENYYVLRIVGHLAKSPSFWISRPQVEQRFEIVNGFVMPSYNHSTTHVRFFGEADLTIQYSDYQVHACESDGSQTSLD